MKNEFKKYATQHLGMSATALESYMNVSSSYISPTIIEDLDLYQFTRWLGICRTGDIRYDAVHRKSGDNDLHRDCRIHGFGVTRSRRKRETLLFAALARADSSTAQWRAGAGFGHGNRRS